MLCRTIPLSARSNGGPARTRSTARYSLPSLRRAKIATRSTYCSSLSDKMSCLHGGAAPLAAPSGRGLNLAQPPKSPNTQMGPTPNGVSTGRERSSARRFAARARPHSTLSRTSGFAIFAPTAPPSTMGSPVYTHSSCAAALRGRSEFPDESRVLLCPLPRSHAARVRQFV